MNILRPLAVGVLLLTMTGCASTSKNECLTYDWHTLGYEDGLTGKNGKAIDHHREACAEAGAAPNLDLYQAGRQEGLREFCRPQNGYRLGERGDHYQGVCPMDVEREFLIAYKEGLKLHALRSDVDRWQFKLHINEEDIADIDHAVEQETSRMASDGLTTEERLSILAETKRLAQRRGALERVLQYLTAELGASRKRLEQFERTQASAY